MQRKPTPPLSVVVNPFVRLDHEGRPAAAVPFDSGDPKRLAGSTKLIGAVRKSEELEKRTAPSVARHAQGKKVVTGDNRKSRFDNSYEFSPEPQKIPDTRFHRLALSRARLGQPAILPADEETARKVGQKFSSPSSVIVATARVQLARHFRNTGDLPEWANAFPSLLPAGAKAAMDPAKIHSSHKAAVEFLKAHLPTTSTKSSRAEKAEAGVQ